MDNIAHITDSHFYNRHPYGIYDSEGVNSRLKEISEIHIKFVDHCISEKVKTIFHSGDLFHTSKPTPLEIKYASKWIEKAIENDIKVYIANGNHDSDFLNSGLDIFKPSFITKNLKIIEDFKIFEDYPIVSIPFKNSKSFDLSKILENLEGLSDDYFVIGHCNVEGGIPGVEISFNEKEPITLPRKIEDFRASFNFGHVHRPQKFFLGSASAISFADEEPKRYWIGKSATNGNYYEIDQTKFITIKTDYDHYKNIRWPNEKCFVRLKIKDCPPGFRFSISNIFEYQPENVLEVKHKIEYQKNSLVIKVEEENNFTLKEALLNYQKNSNYLDSVQAKLELKIFDKIFRD